MKKIENCSLVCVDCYHYGKAVNAIQKSMAQNDFDRVLFLTDAPLDIKGIEIVLIHTIKSKEEYSYFIIKELWKYITTGYVLLIQHDGYTLNGDEFDERLYEYDYCGALWMETDGYANGNGGYSWRSKKFLDVIGNDETIKGLHPEDAQICRTYRDHLQKTYGLKWATDELCERFSFELRQPRQKTMGFHQYFHKPYSPTVVIKRSGAIGDIIMIEPVMRWYSMNGYNVVLDVPVQFYYLFNMHYFPVTHISNLDSKRIPYKDIDLDMAYEINPKQNYLKSYFEICGIKDYKLSRPVLYPLVDEKTKLFKKYAVIHIDDRVTPHRNIFDVKWDRVHRHLEALGYSVIQVGANRHEKCGLEINTTDNIGLLKFVIAGCDLFIGVDSAPSHIAMAYNKKCVLFFGSVNPDYIHPDLSNTAIIQQTCVNQNCWHVDGGTSGQPCIFDKEKPPCCVSDYEEVIEAINKIEKIKHDNHKIS